MPQIAFLNLEHRLARFVADNATIDVGVPANDELVYLDPVFDDRFQNWHVFVVEAIDVNVVEVANLEKVIASGVVHEARDL